MSSKKLFTPEEVERLKANSYTASATADRITYTQAFQKAFWEQSLKGLSGTEAFTALGYDPKILGKERIHNTTKRIRKQGNSPEGIRQKPRGRMRTTRQHFKMADLEKMSHKEAVRRMQQEIVYLQQQVEFLKKIMWQDGSYKAEE